MPAPHGLQVGQQVPGGVFDQELPHTSAEGSAAQRAVRVLSQH